MHCSDASLGFEDRFAIFCDQLGDFLEGLVQRAVDVLELFFQLDAADQQVGASVQGGEAPRRCAASDAQQTAAHSPLRLPCTPQAALCRVPRRRLSTAEAAKGAGPLRIGACAICLCEWTRGDDVRQLKGCSHVFHTRCADTWLWRHQKCPMCRSPLAA